ncbi:hypothetical protein TNCV_1769061 [Trichonephila clavipes]|nr:hypothetical protein TNCV_1769061 [Trichonephila clavipes]
MSSSPVPLETCRVRERCTLDLSRAQTSFRWCCVVVRRGGVPAQVSSSSFDHGLKLRDAAIVGLPSGGSCIKATFARNLRCSRRRLIDEADISTPVAVDQRAANWLEEAVRSFSAMRSRSRSSRDNVVTFRRPLLVVRGSSDRCFETSQDSELLKIPRSVTNFNALWGH